LLECVDISPNYNTATDYFLIQRHSGPQGQDCETLAVPQTLVETCQKIDAPAPAFLEASSLQAPLPRIINVRQNANGCFDVCGRVTLRVPNVDPNAPFLAQVMYIDIPLAERLSPDAVLENVTGTWSCCAREADPSRPAGIGLSNTGDLFYMEIRGTGATLRIGILNNWNPLIVGDYFLDPMTFSACGMLPRQ
jgi:hypothetical protein